MRIIYIYNGGKTTKSVVEAGSLKSFTSVKRWFEFFSRGGVEMKFEKSMISRHWRQSLTNIPSRRGPRCLFTVLDPCPLRAASLSPKIIARHGYRHETTEMEMENPGNSVVSRGRGRSCCWEGRTGPRVRRQICLVRVRIVPRLCPRSLVMVFRYPPPSRWRTARSFPLLLASNELPLIDTSRLRAFSDYYKLWCFPSLSISASCVISFQKKW